MKFWLVFVTGRGYKAVKSFEAVSVTEASKRHLTEWTNKRAAFALVLRLPTGKRHSHCDSGREIMNASASP